MLWTGKTIPRVSVKKYGISYLPYPGKNIKWDPADPTWDYGTSRLKFLIASHLRKHIPGGIKPGILRIPV